MDVIEAIKRRRSIRKYQDREIEEEKINRVLDAGRLAPSARNLQDWRFIVIRDKKTRQKLIPAAKGQTFIGEAPVVIAACGTPTDYVMTCGQHTYNIDVTIAVDHMTLKAAEEGLGTCWIGAFHEDMVKNILNIPEDNVRVVSLLPLGYPAEEIAARSRKELDEIIFHESWGQH